MIDLSVEKLLTFSEVASILPRRRRGRKTAVTTIYRWASRGLHGVRLETIQVGGSLCTSREALQRFFQQLDRSSASAAAPARVKEAKEQATAAERELGRAGW